MTYLLVLLVLVFLFISVWILQRKRTSLKITNLEIILWFISYIILLYIWYSSTTQNLILPGFNVLFLLNLILNFAWIYVYYTLQDVKTAVIINILLISSSIGILLQLQSNLRLIFGVYLLWTLYLLFSTII